jgi:hypothetical protein
MMYEGCRMSGASFRAPVRDVCRDTFVPVEFCCSAASGNYHSCGLPVSGSSGTEWGDRRRRAGRGTNPSWGATCGSTGGDLDGAPPPGVDADGTDDGDAWGA